MDDRTLSIGVGAVVVGGAGILTGLGPDMELGPFLAILFGVACANIFFFVMVLLAYLLGEYDDKSEEEYDDD